MRVMVANLHVTNPVIDDAVAVLGRLKPAIVLACEAWPFHDHLAALGTVHGAPKGTGKGPRECVVVTAPGVKVHEARMVQLTEDVSRPGAPGVWRDRWASAVWCEVEGQRVLAVSWHGNAGIQTRAGRVRRRTPGARQYALGMYVLADLVEKGMESGWAPVVGGDANYRRTVLPLWRHSPHRVLGDLGLVVRDHRVDQIATDPTSHVVTGFDTVTDPPGCDHDWLKVDMTPLHPAPVKTRVTRAREHLASAQGSLAAAAKLLEAAGNRPVVQRYGRETAHLLTQVNELTTRLPER